MLRFSLYNGAAKTLTKVLQGINNLVSDVSLSFSSKGGLVSRTLDVCQAVSIGFKFTPNFFAEFSCTKPFNISIDLKLLFKILKGLGEQDRVIFTYDEDQNPDKLTVEIRGFDQIQIFQLRLYEIDQEFFEIAPIGVQIIAEVPTKFLVEAVDKLGTVGEVVKISLGDNCLSLESKGDDGECRIQLKNLILNPSDQEIADFFSTKYLGRILKGSSCSPETTIIKMIHERPLEIRFQFNGGYLNFMLSPKLNPDFLD